MEEIGWGAIFPGIEASIPMIQSKFPPFRVIAANTAWLISLRTGAELGKGAVLFSVLSAIGAVVVAYVLYNEKINVYQAIGLILGVISIAFLSIE